MKKLSIILALAFVAIANPADAKPSKSKAYKAYMHEYYVKALMACEGKEGDSTFGWSGIMQANGRITYTEYSPESEFGQCVDAYLKAQTYKKPPSGAGFKLEFYRD